MIPAAKKDTKRVIAKQIQKLMLQFKHALRCDTPVLFVASRCMDHEPMNSIKVSSLIIPQIHLKNVIVVPDAYNAFVKFIQKRGYIVKDSKAYRPSIKCKSALKAVRKNFKKYMDDAHKFQKKKYQNLKA